MEIKYDIKNFIIQTLLEIDDSYQITDETQFFEEEILDSVSILFLISELETKYRIQIPLADITEKNFKDLNAIEEYIRLGNDNE